MALEVAAWQTDRGGLTLWVPAAKELFARLRAGESYTVASDWDGTAFALADPCETVVGFVQGPAPEGTCADEFVVTLATEPGDIEERFEWYSKLGFAAADEHWTAQDECRSLVAGPVTIWIAPAPESLAVLVSGHEH